MRVTKAFTRLLISLFLYLLGSSVSYASWCENVGGITNPIGCFCPSTGKHIKYHERQSCLKGVVRISNNELEKFKSELYLSCDQPSFFNENLRCPGHMLSQLEQNKKGSWFGVIESPNNICLQSSHKDPFFDDVVSFEDFVSNDTFYKLNGNPGIISSCLKNIEASPKIKRAFIAKYYRDMNRLKKGVLGNIQAIANIDSLLGNPPANDEFWDLSSGVCENQHIELSVSWCRKYKEDCKPQGGLSLLALKTFKHLPVYFDLQKQKNKTKNKDDKRRIEMAIASIESTYPWMKGNQFKGRIKSANRMRISAVHVENAMREQFLEDRKNHLKNLSMQQGAAHCLNSTYPVKGCKNYDKAIATTPDLPRIQMQELSFEKNNDLYDEDGNERELTAAEREELNSRLKVSMANSYFDDAKCVDEMRGLKSDVNWQIGMTSAQIAITGLSFGAGAIALPGATAAQAGGFVAKAVNHSKIAWNIMKTGVGRGPLLLKGALLGTSALGEAYFMKDEVRDMIDSCDSHLSGTTGVDFEEDRTPNCPRSPESNRGLLTSTKMQSSQVDWKDCALNSALMGLGVMPFLGEAAGRKFKKMWKHSRVVKENLNQVKMLNEGVVARLLTDSLDAQDLKRLTKAHKSRLKDAVATLGRKLSPEEQLAVLKAHYVGFGDLGADQIHLAALGNYSQGQITSKARSLFEAGFSRADVQKLMDSGIAGTVFDSKTLDLAQSSARVDQFLNLAANEGDDSLIRMASTARKKGIENFDVVNGNLVLKSNPNQVMIRGDKLSTALDVDNIRTTSSAKTSTMGRVKEKVKSQVDEMAEKYDRWRRSLAMSREEAEVFTKLDEKSLKWVDNPRFSNKTLCGKLKKGMHTFRRETTLSALGKLRKPRSFGYHKKVPTTQVLDRHLTSTSSKGYMGLATSILKSVEGGNGGRHIARLCINPGALVCIIGGAESEMVLMDSNWAPCKH